MHQIRFVYVLAVGSAYQTQTYTNLSKLESGIVMTMMPRYEETHLKFSGITLLKFKECKFVFS